MLTLTVAILAVTLVSLAFVETRWLGAIGVAVLALLHPWPLIVATASIAIAALALKFHFRRLRNDLPETRSSSD